jgi:hypothetical protein
MTWLIGWNYFDGAGGQESLLDERDVQVGVVVVVVVVMVVVYRLQLLSRRATTEVYPDSKSVTALQCDRLRNSSTLQPSHAVLFTFDSPPHLTINLQPQTPYIFNLSPGPKSPLQPLV